MSDRLSALDAHLLSAEDARTPSHIGSLSVFSPSRAGFDYDTLVQLIEQRIGRVPRYRQKVRAVPGGIARPVWIDDCDFDISLHVRRSALPAPGADAQLHELVSRLMARRLDPTRPLWELYLVEGLAHGRVAVISKTHEALVDGERALALGQIILDDHPDTPAERSQLWMPQSDPGRVRLLAEVATSALRRPGEVVDSGRWITRGASAAVRSAAYAVGEGASCLRRLGRSARKSPLNVTVSRQRRFAVARTELADYRAVRAALGGTINDVVLAVMSAALRTWLLARGEVLVPATTVRALAPVSVYSEAETGDFSSAVGSTPNEVGSLLVDLPVGEESVLQAAGLLRRATRAYATSERLVSAGVLARLAGFAPPALHAIGARAADALGRGSFDVLITNSPGPQRRLYAAGARLLEIFPVVPLRPNQALTVGITSIDGRLYYGLNADRAAVPDIDVLAGAIESSLAELVAATA